MSILSRPYFHDEDAAFAFLESVIWTDGPICGKCGCSGRITKVKANAEKRIRVGLYRCGDCKSQFRVTVGTVFEHIRLPLHKCLQAAHLMCSSKKGISAHQISRTLEVQYKTAWFLCHRIREAMRDDGSFDMLGGANKVVEADETYVGGKAKNRATRVPAPKKAVLSLVERDGKVRSFHVPNVTAENVKPIIAKNADAASVLMTDEAPLYGKIGAEFAAHYTVNHSAREYANACVQVFVEGGSDNFVVSDGGGALQVASTLGLGDLDIEKHLRSSARESCALVNSSGWIFARGATKDSLTSYISTIAECSKAAAMSCARHFKPDAKVSFRRELADELAHSFHKRFERRVTLVGFSNKPHRFDFGLRVSGEKIVVIDAVTPDANSINSAIVSHLDVNRANLPHVQQRVVYDDRYKWRAADLSLLTVGATPVGFTHVVSSLSRLVH